MFYSGQKLTLVRFLLNIIVTRRLIWIQWSSSCISLSTWSGRQRSLICVTSHKTAVSPGSLLDEERGVWQHAAAPPCNPWGLHISLITSQCKTVTAVCRLVEDDPWGRKLLPPPPQPCKNQVVAKILSDLDWKCFFGANCLACLCLNFTLITCFPRSPCKTWHLSMCLNHLPGGRIVGKRGKLAEITLLVFPHCRKA